MLSLYIHIPFCVKKCHYCGFYSTIYTQDTADRYVAALEQEIQGLADRFNQLTVDSVYIGGGTPTALSVDQFDRLLNLIRGSLSIARNAECTVEANPNSLSLERLSRFRELGINRLSIGMQSFSDDVLAFLGRLHTAQEGLDAFGLARRAGFNNIGIDLIYGIPGLNQSDWHKTLKTAAALKPEHISAYSLSLDEGSRFQKEADGGRLRLPADESVVAQYESAVNFLVESGYGHYEISNFSLPGFACWHNLNYWDRGEYLGLGPGAWSFIGSRRWQTVPDVQVYAERLSRGQSIIEQAESLDSKQAANEMIMLALRTSRGLDLDRYLRDCGSDYVLGLHKRAAPFERSGLLIKSDGRMRLTEKGFLLANEVISSLIS